MAKPKIDGTQSPTNSAPCLSPLNHISSEKIKVPRAKSNKSLSVLLNLLSMFLFFVLFEHTIIFNHLKKVDVEL